MDNSKHIANGIALSLLLAPPLGWTIISRKHNPEPVWPWGMSTLQFLAWLLLVSPLLFPLDARRLLKCTRLPQRYQLEKIVFVEWVFIVMIQAVLAALATSTSRPILILLSPLAFLMILGLFTSWGVPNDLNEILLKLDSILTGKRGSTLLAIETEWLFILANLTAEIVLMVLSQISSPSRPYLSATAVGVSTGAMLACVGELYYKAKKAGAVFNLPGLGFGLHDPSNPENPVYNYTDAFGFVCCLVQIIFTVVEYYCHRKNAENPIKVSTVSVTFILCLALFQINGQEESRG